MTDERQRWLRRFHPRDDAEVVLVCFPHAGGAASAFLGLSRAIPPGVDVWAVQYPGRQERRKEPCAATVAELAQGALDALRAETRPLALFGHSMGATVAYETARLLEAAGADVRGLFVSARRAPSVERTDKALDEWTDEAVIAELQGLGGTGSAQLASAEILRMMLPPLRGDYRALRAYRPEPGASVSCPVTALVGDDDPTTPVADARAWRRHAAGDFAAHVFTGGHFYLDQRLDEVVATVLAALSRPAVPGPR